MSDPEPTPPEPSPAETPSSESSPAESEPAAPEPEQAPPEPVKPIPFADAPSRPPAPVAVAGERSRFQLGLGEGLYVAGVAAWPAGMGAAAGYWLADSGTHWMPSMVGGLIVLGIVALIAMTAGSYLKGPAMGRPKGRKRIALFTLLIVAAAAARVGVHVMDQPSPLTTMSRAAFRNAVVEDERQLRELERSLGALVGVFRDLPALQPGNANAVLSDDEERLVLDAWLGYLQAAFALDGIRRFHEDYYRFDISRAERDRHLRSFLLTFAAELTLFVHTDELTTLLERNANVVKFLQSARPEHRLASDSVSYVREELVGATDISRVVAGTAYLRFLRETYDARAEARIQGIGWLWEAIEDHIRTVDRRGKSSLALRSVKADIAPLTSKLKRASYPVQGSLASFIADIRVRRPGRYLITRQQLKTMRKSLEPGDILIGRKNWYLSNVGLPGFWPHALMYVGDEVELKQAFDKDPDVLAWIARTTGKQQTFTQMLEKTYRTAWRERNASPEDEPLLIIEAVSEGVLQNSLPHAAGDYLAALRPNVPTWVKARAVASAFGWLGRDYDFDFDFSTDTTLVCSEVVWRAYRPREPSEPGIRMDPVRVAGRMTLPPNEYARVFTEEHGQPDHQLEFVYFLDASEAQQKALVSDEATFLTTAARSKWDVAQE